MTVPGRSYRRNRRHHARDQTTDPTRVGMLRSFHTRAVPYGGSLVHVKGAAVENRGDGDRCVAWALGLEHSAKLQTAHHNLLLRIIVFQSRERTYHHMSYAKALKKAQCESVETTIRKRRLLFAGAVRRTGKKRLTHRVMFGTMADGVNPGRGRPERTGLSVWQATSWYSKQSRGPRIAPLCCSE